MDDEARDLFRRFDAHLERSDRLIERNTRAFERHAASQGQLVSVLDSIRATMEDMSDQLQANTQAVLSVLDRLDDRGSQA